MNSPVRPSLELESARQRRDAAMIAVFKATGIRLSELAP
jgi:hypothetical protein